MKTASLLLLLFSSFIFSQTPLDYLKEYIKTNTKENTKESVSFFKSIFEKNKIKYQLFGIEGKQSIIAKIEGKNAALKPLLLIHHMDCVNAGSFLKKYKYFMEGSCLLDDKSLGIAHLVSFLELNKDKPQRTVYFLAVSDEENGGKFGTGYLIENKLLPEIGFALGEGGKSTCATDKKLFIAVSTSDKGVIWLEIEIPLPGGQSISLNDDVLRENLKKVSSLQNILPFYGKFEEFKEYIGWLRDAFPSKRKVPENIEEVEDIHKIFVSTTLSITSIKTDGGKNVLPSKLVLTLDIRTAEKENHNKIIDLLKKEFPEAKFKKILELYPSPSTPSDNVYFKKLLKILKDLYPFLPVGPSINPGFSDLRYLREIGIPSFGFSPFFLNYYHEATIHKENERMPESRFMEGMELMKKVVKKLSEE